LFADGEEQLKRQFLGVRCWTEDLFKNARVLAVLKVDSFTAVG
jgi:hypothetical protein|tara:strand:+ start:805 stop:933 length:129 start_codon:yes stop_codon:yes gene_type:complete